MSGRELVGQREGEVAEHFDVLVLQRGETFDVLVGDVVAGGAALFEIAEHCNREQFDELIGPFSGIIVSDRWPGYEHLDPAQRQVCWSHLQRDFRRHSEGLADQKTFGEHGLQLAARV